MRKLTCVYSFFLLLSAPSLFATTRPKTQPRKHAETRQIEPSLQRIAEIQSALRAHGYEPGETWEQTREVCRRIADEHQWQTDHAPDARVLILLGLAGPQADPAVAQMQGGRLDRDQRSEAVRVSAQKLNSEQTTRAEARTEAIAKPATPKRKPARIKFSSASRKKFETKTRRRRNTVQG